ncbi:hypothetical protein Moror_2304 [Moniliophthora roreri MCA 2997]|uniref:Uncharacterized protein n=1 Tax=Moniliophthora roreri (strain MCA 2997) TaxID=1381753 RepID=V2WGD8_MONRO|nr:hypothetical protein Moror_2304 [Moniliophthora roreri MCA 2997]
MNLCAGYDGFFYGIIISTCIFGVTLCQLWNYVNTNWDPWWLRLVIAILYALNIATTVLEIQVMHYYFLANFGDEKAMHIISPYLTAHVLLSALTTFLVDIFFAFRLFLLKQEIHQSVPFIIIVAAIGATISGICKPAPASSQTHPFNKPSLEKYSRKARSALQHNSGFSHAPQPQVEVVITNGLAVVAEVIATAALAWSFRKNKTGVSRADKGCYQYRLDHSETIRAHYYKRSPVEYRPVADDTGVCIRCDGFKMRLTRMPFYFSLNKLYVSTMMAILNFRPALVQDMDAVLEVTQVRHPIEEMNISRNSAAREEVIELSNTSEK